MKRLRNQEKGIIFYKSHCSLSSSSHHGSVPLAHLPCQPGIMNLHTTGPSSDIHCMFDTRCLSGEFQTPSGKCCSPSPARSLLPATLTHKGRSRWTFHLGKHVNVSAWRYILFPARNSSQICSVCPLLPSPCRLQSKGDEQFSFLSGWYDFVKVLPSLYYKSSSRPSLSTPKLTFHFG